MTDAKQFYDYHSWANKKIFTHIENLPEETACQEVKSVFPSVSDVPLHMCRADYIWLNVLSGVAYQEIIDSAGKLESAQGNMALIKQHAAELESQYHDFFSRQTDLEQTFTMQRSETRYTGINLCRHHPACRQSRHLPQRERNRHAETAGPFRSTY